MNVRCWALSLCLFSIFASTPAVFAGDIGSDISRGQFTGEGGYFEVGAVLFAGNSAVIGVPDDGNTFTGGTITLSGRWQKGPAFIEAGNLDTFKLGLSLWNSEHLWVDALISQRHKGLDPDDIDALENSNLREREPDFPIGFRASGYYGQTLIQVTLLSGDLGDEHDGYTLATELGRYWQVRNYNFHWLVSAVYESDKVTHYYWGIDPAQADVNFPAYSADDSWRVIAELGLTLALSEHWVLRGQARYAHLSKEIHDSPIIEDDYATLAALTLSYVF